MPHEQAPVSLNRGIGGKSNEGEKESERQQSDRNHYGLEPPKFQKVVLKFPLLGNYFWRERLGVALDWGGGGGKGVVALGDPCEKTLAAWTALTFFGSLEFADY